MTFPGHHAVTVSYAIVQAEITVFFISLSIQEPISTEVTKINSYGSRKGHAQHTTMCIGRLSLHVVV